MIDFEQTDSCRFMVFPRIFLTNEINAFACAANKKIPHTLSIHVQRRPVYFIVFFLFYIAPNALVYTSVLLIRFWCRKKADAIPLHLLKHKTLFTEMFVLYRLQCYLFVYLKFRCKRTKTHLNDRVCLKHYINVMPFFIHGKLQSDWINISSTIYSKIVWIKCLQKVKIAVHSDIEVHWNVINSPSEKKNDHFMCNPRVNA